MWEQITYNQIMTAVLVIVMAILWIMIGFVVGIIPAFPLRITFTESCIYGMIAASMIWTIMGLVAYFRGDDIILALSKARKIGTDDIHRLNNIIEEMKIASGLEIIPLMYIIDDPALNAFAVGCRPNKAAIIVTSGLLAKLNRDELQGVIAHETAHIKNRDVLLMTMCSMLLGVMVVLSPLYAMLYTSGPNKSRMVIKPRGDLTLGLIVLVGCLAGIVWSTFLPLTLISPWDTREFRGIVLISLIFWGPIFFFAIPLIAHTISSAISRRREYLADATAVLYTRYPEGLASALEKIAASTYQVKSATALTAPLYITNPYREKGMAASDVTETHPPISERIKILRSMARISYTDYDRAYRKLRGTDKSVLPNYAIARTGTAIIRASQRDDTKPLQRARETSNILWAISNYKLINCACGTRMRLPPRYNLSEIRCPHCGKVNPVSV